MLVETMRSCPKIKLDEPEKTRIGILDKMLFFEMIKSLFKIWLTSWLKKCCPVLFRFGFWPKCLQNLEFFFDAVLIQQRGIWAIASALSIKHVCILKIYHDRSLEKVRFTALTNSLRCLFWGRGTYNAQTKFAFRCSLDTSRVYFLILESWKLVEMKVKGQKFGITMNMRF